MLFTIIIEHLNKYRYNIRSKISPWLCATELRKFSICLSNIYNRLYYTLLYNNLREKSVSGRAEIDLSTEIKRSNPIVSVLNEVIGYIPTTCSNTHTYIYADAPGLRGFCCIYIYERATAGFALPRVCHSNSQWRN